MSFDTLIKQVKAEVHKAVFISDYNLNLCFATILAKGHILIEDTPGVGKTTLAKCISSTLKLETKRVQCTNDLLPSDLLGYHLFDKEAGKMVFVPGPVFANIVLIDEINRASPRTQSALLEVMEERTVSSEGETIMLPHPFLVVATQNPSEHAGTFPLPQSQLDRFTCKMRLGYPSVADEAKLLEGVLSAPSALSRIMGGDDLIEGMDRASKIHVSDEVLRYLLALVEQTRVDAGFVLGLSPRASLVLKVMAQAWALLDGRDFVVPDDVRGLFVSCGEHRVRMRNRSVSEVGALQDILQSVPPP